MPRHIFKACRILAAGKCRKSRGEALTCEFRTAITDCPCLPAGDYSRLCRKMIEEEEAGGCGGALEKYPESSYKNIRMVPGECVDDAINRLGDD